MGYYKPNWMAQAKCANDEKLQAKLRETKVDPFFDIPGMSPWIKRYCSTCPVQLDCLFFAMSNKEPHGGWGGLTPTARTHLEHRARTAELMFSGLEQEQQQDEKSDPSAA